MKLSDAFNNSRPPVPSTKGWGRAARRRVARRRAAIGGVAGVGILALVVPLALNLGNSPTVSASPSPATPYVEASPEAVEERPLDCAESVQGSQPTLDDVLPVGWACFPDGSDRAGIELAPDLAREVLDGVRTERVDSGFQPGAAGAAFIVLAASDGPPLRLFLSSTGGVQFYHAGSGGIALWEPKPELARQMWGAVGGSCVGTPAFDAAAVTVDVYSAGADPAAVEFVADRLQSQGFAVRDTGLTTQAMLPGLYFRYAPGNETAAQVLGKVLGFGSGGGELSRTDEVVDVIVTADYEPKVETQQDVDDVAPGPGLFCERD